MSDYILDLIEDQPLGAPPDGVEPDIGGGPDISWKVHVTAGVCAPLIIAFAASRLWSKFRLTRSYKVRDEVIFIFAAITSLAYIGLVVALYAVTPVLGHHLYNVQVKSETKEELILSLTVSFAGFAPLVLIKTSVSLLYLDLFGLVRWLRICAWTGIVVNAVGYLTIAIVQIVPCVPKTGHGQLEYLFARNTQACFNAQNALFAQTVFGVLGDLYLLLLPLPIIYGLKVHVRQKLRISLVFLTGLGALASSTVNMVYRSWLLTNNTSYQDLTWEAVIPSMTALIELTAGLMVASMPPMVTLFRIYKGRLSPWLHNLLSQSGGTTQKSLLNSRSNASKGLSRAGGSEERTVSTTQGEKVTPAEEEEEEYKVRQSATSSLPPQSPGHQSLPIMGTEADAHADTNVCRESRAMNMGDEEAAVFSAAQNGIGITRDFLILDSETP